MFGSHFEGIPSFLVRKAWLQEPQAAETLSPSEKTAGDDLVVHLILSLPFFVFPFIHSRILAHEMTPPTFTVALLTTNTP